MRLFLGIELPQTLKDYLATSLAPLKSTPKGWEDPHDYHMTLLFIGESTPEQLDLIRHRMKDFYFEPFRLCTKGIEFFPRRVMFLSFEASADLIKLKHQVDERFPEWARTQTKTFLPHITIKRWQRWEYDQLEKGLLDHPLEKKCFVVEKLSLFKSEKNERGEKYHVI